LEGDGMGRTQFSIKNQKNTFKNNLLNFSAIPYSVVNTLQFNGLPDFNKMQITVSNNTNVSMTLVLGASIYSQGTEGYQYMYLSGNTIAQLPTLTISAGATLTFDNLPLSVYNELIPTLTGATSGTYSIFVYLWNE
jgi:hypothetical protein